MTPAFERGDTLAAPGAVESSSWRRELAAAIRDLDELWRLLELPGGPGAGERAAAGSFPLLVPRPFLARMRRGDPLDPLLQQVLPVAAEGVEVPGYGADPVGELGCEAAPGLLRKYRGRALLVTTGACAVHCRYCFRRHYPYGEVPGGRRWWAPARAAVAADPTCEELLLSGGDPLTLPDSLLRELVADFAAIPHLRRLRIHSRLPVVLPSRVDAGLLAWLETCALEPVVVIHANHPAEIDAAVAEATRRLQRSGVLVFNQAVLLAGINDDAAVLGELSRRLGAAGVVPYYLHQLDPVAGAAHFEVDDDRARALMRELHAALPGYLLPRLVRELPGDYGKRQLDWM